MIYSYRTGLPPIPIPKWNDEAAYYSLIKTWLDTGQPLGYWGFDGSHALIGTGSAWSSAILLPYAIFGMMFSWNLSSVFYANILFLCMANAIFLFLVKPDKKYLLRILAVQMLSVITILYCTTGMSEPFRYGMAIVLAGVYYKLYFSESSKLFKFVVAPIYIVMTVQIYIFMAFSIPIYIYAIMKNSKWWKQIIASGVAMATVAGISYYILHLISSNYNIYKTEQLFEALKNFDIVGAIGIFLRMFKDGILGLWEITNRYVGHGLFLWFVPFCMFLVFIPALLFLKDIIQKKISKDSIIYAIVSYSVGLFLFMYISVYSLERFTFFRGVGIVVLFSMFLLCFLDNKKIFLGFLVLYGIGIIFLPANLNDFMKDRFRSEAEMEEWEELEETFAEVLIVDPKSEPWENTIAIYTLEPKVISSIPSGMGINMMRNEEAFCEEAKYILFSLEPDREDLNTEWLEFYANDILERNKVIMDEKYKKIYADEKYSIFTIK